MNMEYVPDNCPDFLADRRAEMIMRCASYRANLAKARVMEQDLRQADLPEETKAIRLDLLYAVRVKLTLLHRQMHQCYPFSIN